MCDLVSLIGLTIGLRRKNEWFWQNDTPIFKKYCTEKLLIFGDRGLKCLYSSSVRMVYVMAIFE